MAQRLERLAELLKEEIGSLIHDEVKDPRIGFATVTFVEVSPDVRHAYIHLSVLGDEEAREAGLAGVESAKGFIRTELGKRLRLKFTPELHFRLDRSAEASFRIAKVLRKLHREEEGDGGPDEPEPSS